MLPINFQTRDGVKVKIRKLAKEDEQKIREFYGRLPAEEKIHLRNDLDEVPGIIGQWFNNLDNPLKLHIVAEINGEIVGEASLELSPHAWTRHIAEIRVVVDPKYRRKGIGTMLVEVLISEASIRKIEKIEANLTPSYKGVEKILKRIGFVEVARIKEYYKNLKGEYEDRIILITDTDRVWHELQEIHRKLDISPTMWHGY